MIFNTTYLSLAFYFVTQMIFAQNSDADLISIQQRLDSIDTFKATMKLELDVRFIEMPVKTATVFYQKDKPLEFDSSEFMMLPKRGMDFTMQQLFKYPYLVVDRGQEVLGGKSYKQLSIIPQDDRADFAIATLLLDTTQQRVVQSEISTKKSGTFIIDMTYGSNAMILPDSVTISFEMEDIKLPIQYLSNKMDMEVDKKSLKSQGIDKGRIYLNFSDYQINDRGN